MCVMISEAFEEPVNMESTEGKNLQLFLFKQVFSQPQCGANVCEGTRDGEDTNV